MHNIFSIDAVVTNASMYVYRFHSNICNTFCTASLMYIYVLYVCALEEEMAALQEEFLHHQQKVEEFENLKSEHNQKFVGK